MNVKKGLKFLISLASFSLVLTLPGCSKDQSKYNVSFFDGETLLNKVEVEENSKVDRPTDPTKLHHEFKGWFTETSLEHEFDFNTLINQDTNLYASFAFGGYFAEYDSRFKTLYSTVESQDTIYSDDIDPTFTFSLKTLSFKEGLTKDMVEFSDAFEGLAVKDISLADNKLTISTTGSVKDGKGYVYFAKEVTNRDEYFVSNFDVIKRGIFIEESSIDVDFDGKKVNFILDIKGDMLKNDEALSPEDYLAKIKDKTYDYFKVSNTDKFSLEVKGISEDLSSLVMSLESTDAINLDLVDVLKENKIFIEPAAFASTRNYETHLDLGKMSSTSSIFISQEAVGKYVGEFEIHLNNCKLTKEFKDHIDNLLTEEHAKNLFINIANLDVIINSLNGDDDHLIKGTFTINSEYLDKNEVVVDLSPIKINDILTVNITQSIFNDEPVTLDKENTEYKTGTKRDGVGTVKQTAMSTYSSIKSVIQEYSFEEPGTTIGDIVRAATKIGMIGAGLYTKDFTMAKNAFGDLIGVDSLRNPSYVILDRLAEIMEELVKIEEKLDAINEELKTIQAELEAIGALEYLNTYLTANSAYNAFITDYYVPLTNILTSYTNDYFRYFYDFVMSTLEKRETTDVNVNLYYDTDSNLLFVCDNETISVDGKMVDKSKTKTIPVYELSATISGIIANESHAYNGIENDILCDLANHGSYTENELVDIIKTIRFNAMYRYFSDDERKDNYINAFGNFCRALVGTDTSLTPFDNYRIMMEMVYNFGFEIETDINVAVIKLTSIYSTSRSLLSYVGIIDRAKPIEEQFKELDTKVKNELTSDRFYRHNDKDGNVYCYAGSTYVRPELHSYSIYINAVGIIQYTSCELFDPEIHADIDNLDNGGKEPSPMSVTSITESTARLMAIKVKVYNALKQTSYTFQEYLEKIGLIPEDLYSKVKGIILEIGGVYEDDDAEDLNYGESLTGIYGEGTKSMDDLGGHYTKAGLKGKMYTLTDENVYSGLVGIGVQPSSGGYAEHLYYYGSGYKTKWDDHYDSGEYPYSVEAYSWYIMFVPVQSE